MTKPNAKEIALLLICLLVGFGLRFYSFDKRSLWGDEVYTYNDSRYGLNDQLSYYQQEPNYLHPPLFFILTHLLYPFTKPERDLRVIPLVSGILSIPMIFLLSRQFSPAIAPACTLSLVFMVYHIYLSQDGRPYSTLMFLGMLSLFLLMRYLATRNRKYLLLTAFFFAALLLMSYSSILFIVFSQIFWLYRTEGSKDSPLKGRVFSFLILNGTTFLLILPWLLFLLLNYIGQPLIIPYHKEDPGSFQLILYNLLRDWATHLPLVFLSVFLLLLSPFLTKEKRNALVLLSVLVFPVVGLYLFCKMKGVTHFITSRYFICFLPVFFITLYLSLSAIDLKFQAMRKWIRPGIFFLLFFIASNIIILPLYYRSEKMNLRGLVAYLKEHLREGDEIFVVSASLMPGILHYFGVVPTTRQDIFYPIMNAGEKVGDQIPFIYRNRPFTLTCSKTCCNQFITDGSRVWIVVFKRLAKDFTETYPVVLKGYFDGSFLSLERFPTDASMYLFLWDPQSPDEKGIDLPIE